MAKDVKLTLKELIPKCESFFIALDKTTDCTDTEQLAIFIRVVDSNFQYIEKLLAVQLIKGTTNEEDTYKEYEIQSKIRVSIDETPSMIGSNLGVTARIMAELAGRNIVTSGVH